ncbi:MAG: pentapeptide repeat-containing protein [Gammaproteobacteria bacterium]|nr:pentapeptide repeat-containing protein [Gammaproteobacteria bacterium]NNF62133.1 pentapeptide repeat-containing protein [Gammaproteobacteria bacterium]
MSFSDLAVFIGAIVTLAGVIAAGYRYFAHRERQAIVRTAFRETVDSLGAGDAVHRRAGAIMLRRFFNEKTEQGGKGTPYAQEAQDVIAATLRNIETGSFQKLLADGLVYAPTLVGADLQKTNLQGAYLGPREGKVAELRGADFFRADLTLASLKNADAREAQFYQARLASTVLKGADLRDANFYEADLLGARFGGAKLDGANFANARNVPDEISERLDENGNYISDGAPDSTWSGGEKLSVFLSRPGAANIETRQLVWALADRIRDQGLDVEEVSPSAYATTGALAEVRRVMSGCAGVAVVAVPDLNVRSALWRAATPQAREISDQGLTSPWTCLELGLATGLGLPVFLAEADGVSSEAFDYSSHEPHLYRVRLAENHLSRTFREPFDDWCGAVRERGVS